MAIQAGKKFGGLAHLVERCLCKADVASSSLASSTMKILNKLLCLFGECELPFLPNYILGPGLSADKFMDRFFKCYYVFICPRCGKEEKVNTLSIDYSTTTYPYLNNIPTYETYS
jgi:hypothetical protein